MAQAMANGEGHTSAGKLTGRAFYESIGSPRMVVAPMVDRSEFAWRLLTRSYLDEERSKSLLAYSPMIHARLFADNPKFRDQFFQPTREGLASKEKSSAAAWLDGNPVIDRPLFVQFCANKPDELLDAAQYVAPYCDAVDLNLGCPQGIARAGHYGAFLQEDWDTIYKLINKLHHELRVPVTAKMRVLETREKTLDYAKMILSAGASILTVHGRRREQKGHNTGVADWKMIRYLRDNLPPETVLFANGNILNSSDLETCLAATGADGIMSAEGNLSDPTIFAKPPTEYNPREYWYGPEEDGRNGYRIDAVFRRYLDIIYKYSLEKDPPNRPPLYITSDSTKPDFSHRLPPQDGSDQEGQPKKTKKRKGEANSRLHNDPSIKYMQGHLFQLLRPMLSIHTDIRDALAKTRLGDFDSFERILAMVEQAIAQGMDDYSSHQQQRHRHSVPDSSPAGQLPAPAAVAFGSELTATEKVIAAYKRPWWVCQPHIRPLPEDAIRIGALTLTKKKKEKSKEISQVTVETSEFDVKAIQRTDEPDADDNRQQRRPSINGESNPSSAFSTSTEVPKAPLVCG
ncbi:tRNA-dihydrouridine synthase 1 [Exophiala aquamarina CBS 119918]|uniref:tRNA-dihydrouridine(16/17) synthase [NAD(P)(+)] n=1 Tax=Exophiala aquamarina CBS 119918 TaxID=1182545 RepID=A0A072PCM6_9EURO|nr:tRNA-dihydrouridine synthase 1 [Exophiala aquamarina CBS 119918]KEF53290.1 tRNA-dihydrouridine synthase 1 [Exophiala aquamarina CBS 119918]